MDTEQIRERLQKLRQNLETLEEIEVSPEDLRDNIPLRWQVEHGLQVTIQSMIDIGTHILVSDFAVKVNDYTEVIDRLGDGGVIGDDLVGSLRPVPGLRNILVHEYTDVDYEIVADVLNNKLSSLWAFVDAIDAYID